MLDNDVTTTDNSTANEPVAGGTTDVGVTYYSGDENTPSGTVTTVAEPPTPRAGIEPSLATSQPIAPNAAQDVQNFAGSPQQIQQPKEQSTPQRSNPPAPPQVTQKASWIHDIAQTLAGGPRYQYHVNPNTGEMEKQAVPVSGKHLAMAIALEAMGGAAAGLAYGKGAGNTGKGALAAYQMGEQRVQQQDQLQRQQANADFARQSAIAQTNMRMAMNQRTLAAADQKLHQDYVTSYAGLYDEATKAGAVAQTVHGTDELQSLLQAGQNGNGLHVTRDNAIPIRSYPLMDKDGNPARGKNGEQLYDYDYAIIKPSEEISIPPDALKTLQDYKIPGYVDKDGNPIALPSDLQTKLHLVIDGIEKAQTLKNDEQIVKGLSMRFRNPLNPSAGTTTPAEEGQPAQMPTFKQFITEGTDTPNWDRAADAIQRHEGTNSKNLNLRNNNPGNLEVSSWTQKQPGYVGFEEVNGNKYAKFDNMDNGRQALIAKLKGDYAKYGDMPLDQWVNQHYSPDNAPGNKPGQALTYARDLAGISATTATANKPNTPSISPEQVKNLMQGLSPKQQTLLSQWQLFYDGGPDKASTMDKLTEPGPNGTPPRYDAADVGAVKNVLNQIYPIDQFHEDIANQKAQRSVDVAEEKAKNKQELEDSYARKSQEYLQSPENFQNIPGILNMSVPDATKALQQAGVKVPPELGSLMTVAKYRANLERSFPAKVYKGTPTISAQDAISYIQQFLNPQFDETNYKAAQKFREDLTPGGKVGQSMLAAGVASNHLDLAEQALQNLGNAQWPMWNRAANELGIQAGMPQAKVYQAIADVLSNEVGKVISGSNAVHQTELDRLHDRLSTSDSPQQAMSVLNSYIGLMNGRINEVNDAKKSYFNEELHVSPETARVFGSRGWYVPGYGTPFRDKNTGTLYFSKTGKRQDAKPFVPQQEPANY